MQKTRSPYDSLLTVDASELTYLYDEHGKIPKDKEGRLLRRVDMDTETQCKFLEKPTGTPEYITRALLLRTQHEARRFKRTFEKDNTKLKKINSDPKSQFETQAVSWITVLEKQYIQIDLLIWHGLMLRAEYDTENADIWRTLVADDQCVGYLQIKDKTAHLYTDQPIIVSHSDGDQTEFNDFVVHSTADVCIETPLKATGRCEIYAKNTRIGAVDSVDCPSSVTLIKANQINILSMETCLITQSLDASSLCIKGNHIRQARGVIHCDAGFAIAKQIEVEGIINSEKPVWLFGEKVDYGHPKVKSAALVTDKKAKESEQISQSNSLFSVIGIEVELHAPLRTYTLLIGSNKLIASNQNTVLGDTHIVGLGDPGTVTVTPEARWITTGSIIIEARWHNCFQGHVQALPPLAKAKLGLSVWPTIAEVKEKTLTNRFVFSSPHFVTFSGKFNTSTGLADSLLSSITQTWGAASVSIEIISTGHLKFSGEVWMTTFSNPALIKLASQSIDYQGHLVTSGPVLLKAEEKLEMDMGSSIEAARVKIETQDLIFKAPSLSIKPTYIKAEQVVVEAKRDIDIKKNHFVEIDSPSPVMMQCLNFVNKGGSLKADELRLRAKQLIDLTGGRMIGKRHYYEALSIIGICSRLSVNEQLYLSSYVSLLFLACISSNNFVNNSLVNISPISLQLPSGFPLNSSLSSVAIALFNTALTVVQMTVPEPTVQAVIMGLRTGSNGLLGLYAVLQQSKEFQQLSQLPQDEFTQLRWIQGIKTVVFSLAGTAVGSYMASISHPTSAATSTHAALLSTSAKGILTNINELLGNWFSVLPGARNNSLLNIELASLSLGLAKTGAHLFSLSALSASAFLTSFETSPFAFDASLHTSLLSAQTGVFYAEFGGTVPLPLSIESHNHRNFQTYLRSVLRLQHIHVDTEKLATFGTQHFVDSSLNIHHRVTIKPDAAVTLEHTYLTTPTVDQRGKMMVTGSTLDIGEFKGASGSDTTWQQSRVMIAQMEQAGCLVDSESNTQIKTYEIESTGAAFHLKTQLEVKDLDEAKDQSSQGVMQVFKTQLSIERASVNGSFTAEASDIHAKTFVVQKDAEVGSRETSWDVVAFSNQGDKPDSVTPSSHGTDEKDKKSVADESTGNFYLENSIRVFGVEPRLLQYTAPGVYSVDLTEQGLVYSATHDVIVVDAHIVAVEPVTFRAPDIGVAKHNQSNQSLTLQADHQLTIDETAATDVTGKLTLKADGITTQGGKTQAQEIQMQGRHLLVCGDAKMLAQKDIDIDMQEGVDIKGQKIEDEMHSTKRVLGVPIHTKREKNVEFKKPLIGSAEGAVTVSADHISAQDADLVAKKALTLTAKTAIKLTPDIGVRQKDDHCFKVINSETTHEKIEVISPTHLETEGLLTLQAKSISDVGSELVAREIHEQVPAGGSIVHQAVILQHDVSKTSKGLRLQSAAGIPIEHHENHVSPLTQSLNQVPLVTDIKRLTHPDNFMDIIATGSQLLTKAADQTNSVLNDVRHGQKLGTVIGKKVLPKPEAQITLGKLVQSISEQYVASGSMETKLLDIKGAEETEADFLNNYRVEAKKTYIGVEKLQVIAAIIKNASLYSNMKIGVSIGLSGVTGGSLERVRQHTDSIAHVGKDAMRMGELDLHAREVRMQDAQIEVTHLTGHVDNMISASMPDEVHSQSHGVSVSTGGDFSLNHSRVDIQQTSTRSPFKPGDDNKLPHLTEGPDFTVDNLEMKGQTVSKDWVDAKQIRIVPSGDSYQSRHVSVGLPVGQLMAGALGASSGQVFSSITYDSSQDSTVSGKGESPETPSSHHRGIHWVIPVYNTEAGKQFADNLQWWQQHKHPAPPPKITEIEDKNRSSSKPKAVHQQGKPFSPHQSPSRPVTNKTHSQPPIPVDFVALYMISHQLDSSQIWEDDSDQDNSQDKPSSKAGLIPVKPPYPFAEEIETFRGGGRNIDNIFNYGFKARGYNDDMFAHVIGSAGKNYSVTSNFVGTSLSKAVASTFPRPPFEIDPLNTNLYVIRTNRQSIDPVGALESKVTEGVISSDHLEYYQTEQERVFRREIYPYEIEGAWTLTITRRQGFDPIVSFKDVLGEPYYDHERTIGEEFIPNPNFIPPSSIQKIWSTAKLVGYWVTGVGLVLDGVRLYDQFQDDSQTGHYGKTYHEGGRIVGGWTGAALGARLFLSQAAIFCPPLLTPPGQAVCVLGTGLIGSGIGYYLGGKGGGTIAGMGQEPILNSVTSSISHFFHAGKCRQFDHDPIQTTVNTHIAEHKPQSCSQ